MNPVLRVEKLCAWYGRAQVLFEVSLEAGAGEVVALMGRNGAGKSTTFKALMGLLRRAQGAVVFRGESLLGKPAFEIARLGLGYVPEERRIFTELTVLENLTVGRQPARAGAPVWEIEQLFELFPNLREMPTRLGGRMSGGEQQMLTVARTLMGNPWLVLLDEPSEGLAPKIVEEMARMILTLKARGLSVLLCEQNVHFARLVCDRVYVMQQGQIRYEGPMEQLAGDVAAQRAYLAV